MGTERLQQAYLVRLWAVHHNGDLLWRTSVENVHTGERQAFADLAGLCHFFQTVTTVLPGMTAGETEQTDMANPD